MNTLGTIALRVFREPGRSGTENMRRDAGWLETAGTDNHAVLCFYTWKRPTISLGWMQQASALLDLAACQRDGIDVVQRPTGGRAILHEEEITYSFASTTAQAPFDAGLQATHKLLAECLQRGLGILGVQTELSRPASDPKRLLIRQPCFSSAGRAELMVHGRKLLGSAQRRSQDAFLQHGSLLLGPAHTRIVDYMLETRGDSVKADAARHQLHEATTNLRRILGDAPSFEVLCAALQQGFEQRLQTQAILG
jgi:lipoate-protein ligase A